MSAEAPGIKPLPARRTFPPGVGWVPYLVAIALLLAVSAIAARPQFASKIEPTTFGNDQNPVNTGPDSTNSQDNSTAARTQNIAAKAGSEASTGKKGAAATGSSGTACAAGRNGGVTAPGVSATEIHIGATIVTTGIGSGFLGQAHDGMQVAVNAINRAGGVCGRKITFGPRNKYLINSGWDGSTGKTYIDNFAKSGDVFALVGQPDSEGLDAATESQVITDPNNPGGPIPVVGSDGLLKSQYNSPWIWPVAASTVSNMHIIAQYAISKGWASKPDDFGIVFDTAYKFGPEGAKALNNEVKRLTGISTDIPGFRDPASGCNSHYCGISSEQSGTGGYSTPIAQFNSVCTPCKVVVMLLEPKPMQTWMAGEQGKWYDHLLGGEPLFDDQAAGECQGCGGTTTSDSMIVWTGYRPAIQPFDAQQPVYTFCQALKASFNQDDCHNQFTEGAYLGALMFIDAVKRASPILTRQGLRDALNSGSFDSGLSQPLRYGSTFPRVANSSMAAFQENAKSGKFLGWNYLVTGFIADPHPTEDLH
jgi:ABC-type branched-subunit amino acid transport system substrate-binding protein